ncbi:ribosome maturation factor RimM [Blastomonas sp.]|uniref:ribosome maturation factor RimM n=1 Tax=Blastomonas sp. TaxID=1909299 RepID=UPI003593BE90
MADRPITLAVIVGAHGVTGEVRLKLFGSGLDGVKEHKSFNDGALTLTSLRPQKDMGIARFAEVADRNAAEKARGTELTVPRAALPPLAEGEYYYADLIGLAVESETGEALGTVRNVENFGAGDVLDIARADGKTFMAPVAASEIAGERIVIDAAWAE